MPGRRGTLEERFWLKVQIGDPDACWPWIGATSRSRNGLVYGCIQAGGRDTSILRAPRVALSLRDGVSLTERVGLEACHAPTCTTSLCCNPDHLRWGTRTENEADKRQTADSPERRIPSGEGEWARWRQDTTAG